MSDPRILAIMGSGETAPTMGKIHRALFERLGPGPVTGAIIDTPYGFQENADELSRRRLEFFGVTVGREMTIASYRSRGVGPAAMAAAVSRIRDARYVMAGPGSPSYALRHWAGSPIPAALDAVRVLLDLETVISARLRSGEDSPDLDIAAAVFRSLFVRLGDHVEGQARTLRPRLDLLVSALLDLRAHARARRDWETADLIRDRLVAAHIEVRDGPDGSTRVLPRTAPAGQPASASSPAARSNPGA